MLEQRTYDELLDKLDDVITNLERATRLKRRYEITIGILVAIIIYLLMMS